MGRTYNRAVMVDVSPATWTYSPGEEALRWAVLHAATAHTFRRVTGNITVTSAICDMGADHLLLGVEAAMLDDECVLHNNYHAVPISCTSQGKIQCVPHILY